MSVRVPLHGKSSGYAVIDPKATNGATFGTNIYAADGSLFDLDAYVSKAFAVQTAAPGFSIGPLTNAVDDTAAATAGVAIGALYRNGSIVQIRVT